jgi:glycosidase
MPTTPIEPAAPRRAADANLQPRGRVHRSPADWRDQVLYFLLPDRFNDGRDEAARPRFDRARPDAHRAASKADWMAAGKRFVGGKLAGITRKLDYLAGLGATALWIGPVWRQCPGLETYHGYGIQDFLDVDPRFGTRQDLRDLVDAAHERRMYVILDVIYNHAGDVFFYDQGGAPVRDVPYRFAPPYPVHGWRTRAGTSIREVSSRDEGVWPRELQDQGWYTRAGRIGRWDPASWEDPLHPDNEFRRGDFGDLKNLDLRDEVLSAIVDVYRSWIALSDCDGFRIDTVKHVPFEASRNFCGGIREYAESIGKANFLLLGEVTGGSGMARSYLDVFGRNLDAALDIGDPAERLAGMVKGFRAPREFFQIFGGHDDLGSHREAGRYHVSILDDHDMVGRRKARFSAGNGASSLVQAAHAVGVQLTTLGIPCIYYGTEQGFDGSPARHDIGIEPLDPDGKIPFEDRYLREAMFGGDFGAFETAGCHFFDETSAAYLRIAAIARVRAGNDAVGLALRRGRVYQRQTSFLGRAYDFPGPGEFAAWSRILFRTEVLVCLNTHGSEARGADVTIDAALNASVPRLRVLYRGDWSDAELGAPPGETVAVRSTPDGRKFVHVDLPPAGMVLLSGGGESA